MMMSCWIRCSAGSTSNYRYDEDIAEGEDGYLDLLDLDVVHRFVP